MTALITGLVSPSYCPFQYDFFFQVRYCIVERISGLTKFKKKKKKKKEKIRGQFFSHCLFCCRLI